MGLVAVCLWAASTSSVGHGGAEPVSGRSSMETASQGPSTRTSTSPTISTALDAAVPAPPTVIPATVPATAAAVPPAPPVEDDPVPRRASVQRSGRAPAAAGRIIVPRLRLDTDFYEGGELAQIDFGPSHMPNTALPGYRGNTVFAGHRVTYTRPFRDLDQLVRGDTVTFVVDWGTFTYGFTHLEVVPEEDTTILLQTPTPTATLFACHPPGSSRYRIVARFKLISAPAPGTPSGPNATPLYEDAPSGDTTAEPTPVPTTAPPPPTTSTSLVLPGRK